MAAAIAALLLLTHDAPTPPLRCLHFYFYFCHTAGGGWLHGWLVPQCVCLSAWVCLQLTCVFCSCFVHAPRCSPACSLATAIDTHSQPSHHQQPLLSKYQTLTQLASSAPCVCRHPAPSAAAACPAPVWPPLVMWQPPTAQASVTPHSNRSSGLSRQEQAGRHTPFQAAPPPRSSVPQAPSRCNTCCRGQHPPERHVVG